MRAVIVCLLAALFTMTAPARAEAPKRVVLVIGNAAYQSLAPLGNPRLDAAELAALLDANGFDVVRCDGNLLGCFDLNRDGLKQALETLRSKADAAGTDRTAPGRIKRYSENPSATEKWLSRSAVDGQGANNDGMFPVSAYRDWIHRTFVEVGYNTQPINKLIQ